MTSILNAVSFPELDGIAGVRRIADATKRIGRPAMDVVFMDGLTVTVTKDEIRRDQFCIFLPPNNRLNISSVIPSIDQAEVMVKLSEMAANAARTTQHSEKSNEITN